MRTNNIKRNKIDIMKRTNFIGIDIFSGAGGLSLGAGW